MGWTYHSLNMHPPKSHIDSNQGKIIYTALLFFWNVEDTDSDLVSLDGFKFGSRGPVAPCKPRTPIEQHQVSEIECSDRVWRYHTNGKAARKNAPKKWTWHQRAASSRRGRRAQFVIIIKWKNYVAWCFCLYFSCKVQYCTNPVRKWPGQNESGPTKASSILRR